MTRPLPLLAFLLSIILTSCAPDTMPDGEEDMAMDTTAVPLPAPRPRDTTPLQARTGDSSKNGQMNPCARVTDNLFRDVKAISELLKTPGTEYLIKEDASNPGLYDIQVYINHPDRVETTGAYQMNLKKGTLIEQSPLGPDTFRLNPIRLMRARRICSGAAPAPR